MFTTFFVKLVNFTIQKNKIISRQTHFHKIETSIAWLHKY